MKTMSTRRSAIGLLALTLWVGAVVGCGWVLVTAALVNTSLSEATIEAWVAWSLPVLALTVVGLSVGLLARHRAELADR